MKIIPFYNRNYKKLFFVPIVLVVLALAVIIHNYASTGDFIDKDVSLKGGITATVYTEKETPAIKESLLERFPGSDIEVRHLTEFGTEKQIGLIVEASNVKEAGLTAEISKSLGMELTDDNYSVELVGSSLGDAFYKQMLTAIVLAFLFMAIVVFIAFRALIPSAAVVLAAFTDIIVTVAILDLAGIKLSTAGIAALLLLIGYSIDTDILLTTKILKRRTEGSIIERLMEGASTGLTMTATTIVALTVGYLFSTSEVLRQMFLIIIIGLAVDIIATYFMNAGLLVWYARRKHHA